MLDPAALFADDPYLLDAIGGYVDTASRHELRDATSMHRNEVRPENTHGDLELPDGRLERYVGASRVASRTGVASGSSDGRASSISGDLAPGFGGFEAELEESEDDDSWPHTLAACCPGAVSVDEIGTICRVVRVQAGPINAFSHEDLA